MDTWIASGEYRTALSLSRLNVKEEESGVDTWTILGDAWMSYLTEPTALTSIEAATLLGTGNHPTVTRIPLRRKRCSNVDCIDYVLYY